LKRQVATRQATPADIERGHLLLCQLHIDRREPDLARPHLEALRPTLDKARFVAMEKQIEQAATATPIPQEPAAKAAKAAAPKKAPVPQPAAQPAQPAAQPALTARGAETPAAPSSLESLWSDLDKTDAVAARALLQMVDKPKETVGFLKEHLKSLKINADRVQTLLANLGSEKEETWTAAYEELEYFDPRLAIDLETLMADVTTSPTRQRLVEILSSRARGSLEGKEVTLRTTGAGSFNFAAPIGTSGGLGSWWAEAHVDRINVGTTTKRQWTRAVRAIVLLEHIGTPDAVAILRDMAGGHPDAQPTKTAVEALGRVDGKGK